MTKPAKSRKRKKWEAWAIIDNERMLQHQFATFALYESKEKARDNLYFKTDSIIPVTITEGHGRKK